MTTPKYPGDDRPTLDAEVDFAGYDPYIVALTGGGATDPGTGTASTPNPADDPETTESRKVKLMTWLREHRA